MISSMEIIKAFSNLLREAYGQLIKDVDIEKNIPRPCIVIEVDGIESSKAAVMYEGDAIDMSIYFFHEQRHSGYAELLDCQRKLRGLLDKPVEVSAGFFVVAENLTFTINKSDKVLIAAFTIYMVQEVIENDDDEPMEELEVNWEN